VSLDISGGAGHPHTVMLSAGEVVQIAGGSQVSKTSTTNQSHSHQVTFN
jgi:ethanolamine utilization microcompartment shell protein EutL